MLILSLLKLYTSQYCVGSKIYIQVWIYILNTFPQRRWQIRNQLNLTVFYHMELESFKKAQGRVALYRLGDTWTFELTAKNEFLYYQKCFYLKCLSLSCFILEKMLMFRSQKNIYWIRQRWSNCRVYGRRLKWNWYVCITIKSFR